MKNNVKIEDILKELEHLLEQSNRLVEKTPQNSSEHSIFLGYGMALSNLKYSINNNSWLYKKENK